MEREWKEWPGPACRPRYGGTEVGAERRTRFPPADGTLRCRGRGRGRAGCRGLLGRRPQRQELQAQLLHNLLSSRPAVLGAVWRRGGMGGLEEGRSHPACLPGTSPPGMTCLLASSAPLPAATSHCHPPLGSVLVPAPPHQVGQCGRAAGGRLGTVLVLRHLQDDLHGSQPGVGLLTASRQLPHCSRGRSTRGSRMGLAACWNWQLVPPGGLQYTRLPRRLPCSLTPPSLPSQLTDDAQAVNVGRLCELALRQQLWSSVAGRAVALRAGGGG